MLSPALRLPVLKPLVVIVEDANGNIAVDGIHTVGTGDSSCYNVATTVSSGVLPTTLSVRLTSFPDFC